MKKQSQAAPAAGTQVSPVETAQQEQLKQQQEQKKIKDQQTTQKGIQSSEIGRQLEETREQGKELSKNYQYQKNEVGDALSILRKQRQDIMSADTKMMKQIMKLADDLDASGFYKEASELDKLLKRG